MIKLFVRKIIQVGLWSLSINIPMEIIKELKIKERQKMVDRRRGKRYCN